VSKRSLLIIVYPVCGSEYTTAYNAPASIGSFAEEELTVLVSEECPGNMEADESEGAGTLLSEQADRITAINAIMLKIFLYAIISLILFIEITNYETLSIIYDYQQKRH